MCFAVFFVKLLMADLAGTCRMSDVEVAETDDTEKERYRVHFFFKAIDRKTFSGVSRNKLRLLRSSVLGRVAFVVAFLLFSNFFLVSMRSTGLIERRK